MKTTIDRFGRVLIPKAMRDDLGLDPGTVVEIAREANALRLRPVEGEPAIEERRGVLVFVGEAQGDLRQAISRHREGRLHRLPAPDTKVEDPLR